MIGVALGVIYTVPPICVSDVCGAGREAREGRLYKVIICDRQGLIHRWVMAVQYMTEASFNWRMIKNICAECHVFDEETNYKAFDSVEGAPKLKIFEWQRKFL